jgi:3-phosphoglycerate kinase
VIRETVTEVVSYAIAGVLSFTFLALLGLVVARESVEEAALELSETK